MLLTTTAPATAVPDLSPAGPVAWSPAYSVYRGGSVWLGGPPDAAALATAKGLGLEIVVDLRGPEEETATTAAAVRASGLAYHSVPFPKGAPLRAEAVQRVAEIVASAAPGSVLVHCSTGQRAAGWWASDLIMRQDMPVDQALAAARTAGLEKDTVAAGVRAFAQELQARRIADEAANQLAGTLMGRLQAALDADGVEAGAKVCAEMAQSITADVGARHGATVARTALRVRNPANRPDRFEKDWLITQQERVESGRFAESHYEVVATADGKRVLRHLRPILFPGGICVQCHGSVAEIPEEVKAFLHERYPDDEATGYAAGDLRGAISVRVPID